MAEQVEADKVIEILLGHKLEFARGFLKDSGLPADGTKEGIGARLNDAVEDGTVSVADLVRYLDDIEGWGNQHVYLVRAPAEILARWRDLKKATAILEKNELLALLNKAKPVFLPARPTLATIELDTKRARFVWVVKRSWEEHVEERDTTDGDWTYRAYVKRTGRGILSFDWDLGSGVGMIMIQRLPSSTNYERVRNELMLEMRDVIELSQFEPIRIAGAITRIAKSSEVDVRKHVRETRKGGKATLQSRSRKSAVKDDPDLRNAEAALGAKTVGNHLNVYWLPTPKKELPTRLHTTLHTKDHRIGIYGDRTEDEVRYVIGRIRSYC